jgi:hypothetical protein
MDGEQRALLRRWARLLDHSYRIPVLGVRFGWDPILGLLPGVGDLVTPAFAGLLLVHAMSAGVPKIVQLRMVLNVLIDAGLGAIPLAGDLFDVAWKANARNLRLLERHAGGATPPRPADYAFVGAVLGVLALCAALPLLVVVWLARRVGVF